VIDIIVLDLLHFFFLLVTEWWCSISWKLARKLVKFVLPLLAYIRRQFIE